MGAGGFARRTGPKKTPAESEKWRVPFSVVSTE